jgi:hypothetical protein
MMGRLKSDQGQLFYEFHLGNAVPEDHLVRKIDAALDLSWLRGELASHYSSMGRPSIEPELMIRMLVVGYVFAERKVRIWVAHNVERVGLLEPCRVAVRCGKECRKHLAAPDLAAIHGLVDRGRLLHTDSRFGRRWI